MYADREPVGVMGHERTNGPAIHEMPTMNAQKPLRYQLLFERLQGDGMQHRAVGGDDLHTVVGPFKTPHAGQADRHVAHPDPHQ